MTFIFAVVKRACNSSAKQSIICGSLLSPQSSLKPLTEFKLIYGLRSFIDPHCLAVLTAQREVDFALSPESECRL